MSRIPLKAVLRELDRRGISFSQYSAYEGTIANRLEYAKRAEQLARQIESGILDTPKRKAFLEIVKKSFWDRYAPYSYSYGGSSKDYNAWFGTYSDRIDDNKKYQAMKFLKNFFLKEAEEWKKRMQMLMRRNETENIKRGIR